MKRYFLFLILALMVGGAGYFTYNQYTRPEVTTFEECRQAGYLLQETDPVRCIAKNGIVFLETEPEPRQQDSVVVSFQTVMVPPAATWQTELPRVTTVTTAAEWTTLWQQMTEGVSLKPMPPQVDLENAQLVAISVGQKPSGGYTIEVQEVRETEQAIKIAVREEVPGENCITTSALTYPYQVISIPRSEKRVEVNRTKVTVACTE
jgi:hypothetical protein